MVQVVNVRIVTGFVIAAICVTEQRATGVTMTTDHLASVHRTGESTSASYERYALCRRACSHRASRLPNNTKRCALLLSVFDSIKTFDTINQTTIELYVRYFRAHFSNLCATAWIDVIEIGNLYEIKK